MAELTRPSVGFARLTQFLVRPTEETRKRTAIYCRRILFQQYDASLAIIVYFFRMACFPFPTQLKGGYTFVKFKITLWLVLAIEIFYRWPTWIEETPRSAKVAENSMARRILIRSLRFFCSECSLALGVSFLLALLWVQWSSYYIEQKEDLVLKWIPFFAYSIHVLTRSWRSILYIGRSRPL